MPTTFSTTTSNPHIAALEEVFTKSNNSIEWLVISHDDSRMVRSLCSNLPNKSTAVLEISQSQWDFESKDLAEAFEWALQQSEIKHVVLVGNSQASTSKSRASLVGDGESNGGFSKLLAGVKRNNAQNGDAQKDFASHVQKMSQIPVLHNRWSNGDLEILGIFYRAESGVFVAYDADSNTFQPLVG